MRVAARGPQAEDGAIDRQLFAQTPMQYTSIAAALTADQPRVRELCSTLRLWMEGSPLMDAGRFDRNVEDAYRRIWRPWCAQANERT